MKLITTKKSKNPGKTVAIFAGIHGDEKAGIKATEKVIKEIDLQSGTVHFVLGNPKAVKKNIRYTESNLNRDFIKTNSPKTYEQKRAQELMELLDNCDALLDLHAYKEPLGDATPFAICEPHCFEVVKKLPIKKIVSNITSFQDGSTNGYMDKHNKIGVVVELGAIETPEKYVGLGVGCIYSFLHYFSMVESRKTQKVKQDFLKVAGVHRKNVEEFSFSKKRKSFDKVEKGEVIAKDGLLNICAESDGRILFPNPNGPVGVEVFWFLTNKK